MNKSLKADMMLVLVTLCWGISYYFMDICLADMDPMNLNAYRFLVAFIVAFAISGKRVLHPSKATIKYSFLVALFLVVVYCGATYGVKYTSISNAGFINGLSTVFTPIIGFLLFRRKPERKIVAVIIMCMIGISLLSLDSQLHVALGDLLCLAAAVAYGFDLCFTETAVKHPDVNPFQLGVYQLLFVGIFMLAASFVLEDTHLPQSPAVWGCATFLAVFCTGVAFVVQAIAQQYTSANRVGIIFSLEPVFSGITAFFLAGEVLLPRAYFGAILMIAGMFIMEVDFSNSRLLKNYRKR